MKPGQTPLPVQVFRVVRIGLLFLSGAVVVSLIFPLCGALRRRRLKASWSAAVVDTLGVEISLDSEAAIPPALIVANHISWLDIFAINAMFPAAFVAKAEVREWPLIGWLAARNDTVFLRRGSRGHAQLINAEIAQLLDCDNAVAVFPEGTTSDGTRVLNFHGALIQPALLANKPVVPLAISYWEARGQRSLAPRYDGDLSLGQSLRNLLKTRKIVCRIKVCSPVLGNDRKQVSAEARALIEAAIQ